MKNILVASVLLFAQALAQEKTNGPDPFADRSLAREDRQPVVMTPSQKLLGLFGEPDLSVTTSPGISVRFIWIPTFDHPISIRAFKENGKATITVVKMTGRGGYDWGKAEFKTTIPIDDKKWARLLELYSAESARAPIQMLEETSRRNVFGMFSGFDGSVWYLEVRDRKGYTVEGIPNPTSPDEVQNAEFLKFVKDNKLNFKPFLAVCYYMFELSGLKDRPNY